MGGKIKYFFKMDKELKKEILKNQDEIPFSMLQPNRINLWDLVKNRKYMLKGSRLIKIEGK